jgi:hypothetical protein
VVDGSSLWFGEAGFEVLCIADDGVELVIDVESTAGLVGCHGCGTRAVPKDRRWVTLRDVSAGRRFVRVRWRKRIWRCVDPDCEVNTWTEHAELAEPRRVLTTRAAEWATDRVEAIEGTPASIARGFGLSWSTVWSAVERIGGERVQTPAEVGPAEMVGFDETVMSPASRRRRRRFVTAVVDVGSGGLLDVFEGRDAKHLRAWIARMPLAWLSMIRVVSVDPHEGYRGAVLNPDPSQAARARWPVWSSWWIRSTSFASPTTPSPGVVSGCNRRPSSIGAGRATRSMTSASSSCSARSGSMTGAGNASTPPSTPAIPPEQSGTAGWARRRCETCI